MSFDVIQHTGEHTLFYFDPPYKPLSTSSNFTNYSKSGFNDADQVRLRDFCNKLDEQEISWILSNSDTKCGYFEQLYKKYNITKVKANRSINRKVTNKNWRENKVVTELLIHNGEPEFSSSLLASL